MNNSKSYNTVHILDHNTGDQSNAIAGSHQDLKRRRLPALFRCDGAGDQKQNACLQRLSALKGGKTFIVDAANLAELRAQDAQSETPAAKEA